MVHEFSQTLLLQLSGTRSLYFVMLAVKRCSDLPPLAERTDHECVAGFACHETVDLPCTVERLANVAIPDC